MTRSSRCLVLVWALLGWSCGNAIDEEGWSARQMGTDALFLDVFFLDPLRGWVVGGGYPVEGGIVGSTVDGGETWKFQSGLVRRSNRPETVHLQAVQFLDERRGFIVADRGLVLRTLDGGQHWHPVHRGGQHLHDLQFVDPHQGWAVGGSTLIRTVDGGETWNRPMPPGSQLPFNARAIQFLDRQQGWAVGGAGAIYGSGDGGESWTPSTQPRSGEPDLWALDFVDIDRGWVVGEGGTILHTEDRGLTWTRQPTPTSMHLTGVCFLDSSTGWAIGFDRGESSSVILHTADGGASWVVQFWIAGEALFALDFVDKGRGWAVGERIRPHPQRLLRYRVGAAAGD